MRVRAAHQQTDLFARDAARIVRRRQMPLRDDRHPIGNLENLVEVTRNLPEFPLASGDSRVSRHAARDPRMSPRVDGILDVDARRTEQCALTQPISKPAFEFPDAMPQLTVEQLDRLRRCANGNTLRFEASDIVEALVDAGYATEGVGRVVTVTPKGHRYLLSHPA